MSLKVDKVQLEIIMKSDQTRAEIGKLEEQASLLQKQMKGLKKDSQEYIQLSSEYKKVKGRIDELKGTIELTGKTMRELTQRARELRVMINNLTPGSAKWKEYQEELKAVNARMRELRGSAQKTEHWFSATAGRFNKYFALLGTSVAAITGMSMTFRKLAEEVAHMDDVFSDVMKTTGNTKEQVLELNEEFKKMDTRTSREQLNLLARDAGKLGLSAKKDILDFVEAGNQINVALGEDLGEGAIRDIGKLVDVFSRSTDHLQGLDLKGKMLAVGSAINELGASSTASEKYLVNFMGRLGGVSAQAGISADAIMGYASALDQDMQAVEMSATALQKFIMKLMGDPAKFARIAGLEVKSFTNLMQTDVNAAMKQVLRALNDKGGFQQLIPIFQDMGLDGARAVGVLSAMASSIDKIDEAQRIANEAMIEGTSLTTEYNIKNENLAAKLDKARKNFKEVSLELGESLNPILLNSTKATSYLIKGLVTLIRNWDQVAKVLAVLAGYLIAYNAQKLKNIILMKEGIGLRAKLFLQRLRDNILLQKEIITEEILAATKGKTTLATKAAAAAQVLWNNAIKANPIGWLIGLLTTVVGLIFVFRSRTAEARKEVGKIAIEKRNLTEVNKSVNAEIERENINLDIYKKRLLATEPGSKERIRLVKELNKKYPDLLTNIDAENASINTLRTTMDLYIKNLTNVIRAKVLYAKITEKVNQLEDEKDYSKRQKLKQDIEYLKEQHEMQLLVNLYGEKNAKLISQQAELQTKHDALEKLAGKPVSYEEYTKDWKQRSKEKGVFYKTEQAAIDAMNKSYSEYLKKQQQWTKKFNEISAKLKQIDDIINSTPIKETTDDDDDDNNNNNNTPPDDPDKNKKDPGDEAIKNAEEFYKKDLLALKNALINKEITEKEFAEKGEKALLTHLEDKLFLQNFYGKSTVDTETAIADWKLNQQKTEDEKLLEKIKETNDEKLRLLGIYDEAQKEYLQDLVDSGTITNSQYQANLLEIETNSAKVRLEYAQQYLKEVNDSEFHSAEAKKKAVDDATKAVEQAQKAEEKAVKAGNRAKLKAEEDFQKERENLLKSLGILSIRQQYELEKKELDKHLADELLSVEEHAEAVRKLKAKKAEAYAQQAVEFAGYVADAVSAYHQMEADSLEAEKQRELAAAGDNAEKRKKIEDKYAQKELDLKKKQANADAGIKIAQTIAAGALAAIQAFAQLGPVAGAVAAALIATTTAFQIASIIKQRNAIMATTLDSSSSSGESSKTGKIVARQAYIGRYDVVGEDDRRTYRNVPYIGTSRSGLVTTPTLVGERGDELIISNPHLRNIQLRAPHLISQMMSYRIPQRAEGKYDQIDRTTPSQNDELIKANTAATLQLIALLKTMQTNGIDAYVLLSDLERKQKLNNKSKAIGTI